MTVPYPDIDICAFIPLAMQNGNTDFCGTVIVQIYYISFLNGEFEDLCKKGNIAKPNSHKALRARLVKMCAKYAKKNRTRMSKPVKG